MLNDIVRKGKPFFLSSHKKILLYLSSCRFQWYCQVSCCFFSQKKILRGGGVKWSFYVSILFSRYKKLYCISQVVGLNDVVRKEFFLIFPQQNSTLSLRLWCYMILLDTLFIFLTQKLYCISLVLVLNNIFLKTSYFLLTRKFNCISEVVVLNDIVR